MGKAIEGGVLLAAGVGMLAAGIFDPYLFGSPLYDKAMYGLLAAGATMEAGAIAQALTNNSATAVTMHQAAAPRQIIYGQRRVKGTVIYESTTGSHHDQVNMVIVLAGHVCHSIVNLYLDGRQVFWNTSSSGNVTRNGINFGGSAASGSHVGPGGATYDFGGIVYAEPRFGDQSPGDVIGGLTANDPSWAADGHGNSPWVGGCTYIYLKMVVNAEMFPNGPLQTNIDVTVNGKSDIYDPRTGTTGWSNNWAICIADKLTDTVFGLGDTGGVNQAQLIAAANVCDELVPLGIGGTEKRYTLNWMHNSDVGPGSALDTMMSAAQGRLRNIGGEWFIFPAYWQGPVASFDGNALTAKLQWKPTRSARDLVNRVNGTYIAANYPYNTAGNLYDANGWYEGTIANNYPFAWQPTNYPQYAADTNHGYSSDQWLTQDGGIQRPLELAFPCVISITQAQRLAKIALLRNRWQGSGELEMSLMAWGQMQSLDVMHFTFPTLGWTDKVLEADTVQFRIDNGDGVPNIRIVYPVAETDASVYAWSVIEEQTPYDVPSNPAAAPLTPNPPTSMTVTSSAATAVVGLDGIVTPRAEVQWSVPLDRLTTHIQVQYALVTSGTAGPWLTAAMVDSALTSCFVSGVVAGSVYDFRIRGVRSATGAVSSWVEVDGVTVGLVLSVTSNNGVGVGSLVGEAESGGTADIICTPFTFVVGSASISVLPAGYTITGLNQAQLYYVYYVDLNLAGGAVTPIATQNTADFMDKVGYFLIDSIITPSIGGTGGGGQFLPVSFSDVGPRTTQNPTAAYDGDVTTAAIVSGSRALTGGLGHVVTGGQCIWSFAPTVLAAAASLNVVVQVDFPGGGHVFVIGNIGSTSTIIFDTTVAAASASYSMALPAGTDLGTVTLVVDVSPSAGLGVVALATVFEIFIQ